MTDTDMYNTTLESIIFDCSKKLLFTAGSHECIQQLSMILDDVCLIQVLDLNTTVEIYSLLPQVLTLVLTRQNNFIPNFVTSFILQCIAIMTTAEEEAQSSSTVSYDEQEIANTCGKEFIKDCLNHDVSSQFISTCINQLYFLCQNENGTVNCLEQVETFIQSTIKMFCGTEDPAFDCVSYQYHTCICS